MSDRWVSVLERDGKFIAGVFSSHGLYAVNLPAKSRKAAIDSVNGRGLELVNSEESLKVLEAALDASLGRPIDTQRIPFDFSGLTEKQVKVLELTRNIPHGSTLTYGDIASNAGIRNGARFVGNVMSSNRFPPLIPCHRVVAKDGLGGYGAGDGIATKRALLAAERKYAE